MTRQSSVGILGSERFGKATMIRLLKINVGPADAFLRVFGGLVIFAFLFAGLSIDWAWVGAILLLTGAMRRCPVYLIAGINTQRH
jgi:Protein of unknown function (DUF2892)